uniref:BTB domain-containing protein n=1 Tax=Panagrolaimus superbus TaxID=310955 RepID=A0A914XXW2_9BILA
MKRVNFLNYWNVQDPDNQDLARSNIRSLRDPKKAMQFPIALEWTINAEKLKVLRENECVESKKFEVCGLSPLTYCLEIWPNGCDEKRRGKTCIFLRFRNVDKTQVDFILSIESAKWEYKISNVYTKPTGCGSSCCPSDELFDPAKKFIVDEKMIIKVKGFVKSEIMPIVAAPKNTIMADDLGNSMWNDENKDFTITVKEKNKQQDLKAHKNVLALRSSVFATMFKSEFKEGQENKVEITDFPFKVVEFGIKSCYIKTEFDTIKMEKNILLLQFFEKYNMEKFKAELENYLIHKISVSNVCSLVKCSELSNSPKLEKHCTEFLLNCMKHSTPVFGY